MTSLTFLFLTVYPEPGWHEHDPSVYMASIDKCIKQVLEEFASLGYEKEMLKGVGIATQRETTLVWDKNTGRPLCNASKLLPASELHHNRSPLVPHSRLARRS